MGWLTVVLYALAAWQSYRLLRLPLGALPRPERMLWSALALGLLALGINKQLDLQSALTEIGRMAARQEGWYERRRAVQLVFIATVAVAAVVSGVGLGLLARNAPMPTRLSLLGCVFLLGFVVVRAASFHHMDRFISAELLGLKMNWIMAMGGICIIAAGAHWRGTYVRPAAIRSRRSV